MEAVIDRQRVSRLRLLARNLAIVVLIVGPVSFAVGGRLVAAWGLGWGVVAVLVWTLFEFPGGWIIGLSGAFAVGVGSFGLTLPSFRSYFLYALFWGVAGGLAWYCKPGVVRVRAGTLGLFGVGAMIVGFFGTLVAAFIGNVLFGLYMKAAGGVINFMITAPVWTIGLLAGLIAARLTGRMIKGE